MVDQIAAFFKEIYGEHKGWAVIAYPASKTSGVNQQVWFSLPSQHQEMASWAASHAEKDLYFTPFLWTHKKRDKSDPGAWTQCVYADVDDCDPKLLKVEPTLLWQTSPGVAGNAYGRNQALWVVTDPLDVQDAAELSRGLAYAHKDDGCDTSGWDIGQLLRIPGSTHSKREPVRVGFPAKGAAYTLDALLEHYEGIDSPEAQSAPAVLSAAREALPPKLPRHIQGRLDGTWDKEDGDRSKAARVLVFLGAQYGLSDGQLLTLLDRHPKAQGRVKERPNRNWDSLFLNEIADARAEHPHTGSKCEEAACKNTPEWIKKKNEPRDVEEWDPIEEDDEEADSDSPSGEKGPESPIEKEKKVKPTIPGAPSFLDGWDDDLSGYGQEPHLIQNLVEKGTICWLVGESGTFKSFIGISISIAVASGAQWYGRETFKGPVAYICSEGPKNWPKRMAAYKKHFGLSVDRNELRMYPAPVQIGGDEWKALQADLSLIRPHLIVVDTQSQCTNAYEENSNTDMAKVVNAVREMSQATGAAVLVVHHAGHQDDGKKVLRGRGASSVYAAADTEITVRRLAKERGERMIEVEVTKQKDMPMGKLITLMGQRVIFEERLDYYGNPLESLVMVESDDDGGGDIARGTAYERYAEAIIKAGVADPSLGQGRLPKAAADAGVTGLPAATSSASWAKITKAYKDRLAKI